ncbi:GNAT family N-acetyltransferase [Paenibacillus lautus]|nr:GNAT family N-acetyltransferase [Paenibacillus lautus]
MIAKFNNEVVGYAQTSQVNEEEYELLRIYVRPEYHKKGNRKRLHSGIYTSFKANKETVCLGSEREPQWKSVL